MCIFVTVFLGLIPACCTSIPDLIDNASSCSSCTDSSENYKNSTNASKAYKRCINKQFHQYRKDFVQKLRSLKTSDPKSYWSMLNKATSSNHSKTMKKKSLELFAEHFKKLNTVGNSEQGNYPNIDLENISDFNISLNCEIKEEVSKCIYILKLNKACSSDLIRNEFLKHSKTYMLTAFTLTAFNRK